MFSSRPFVRFSLAWLVAMCGWAQSEFRFSSGERVGRYRLSADEVYVRAADADAALAIAKRLASVRLGEAVRKMGKGALIVVGAGARPRMLPGLRVPAGAVVAPIFYDLEELPAEERLAAMPPAAREERLRSAMRIVTPRVHVRLGGEEDWESLQQTAPLSRKQSLIEGWTVVTYADEFAALAAVEWLAARGNMEFSPVFARYYSKKQALLRGVNDPLFRNQWHLGTQGVNLSMGNTWDSYTGRGINIAVVDDGLFVGHEDFAGNVYPIEGNYHRNFLAGEPNDPTPDSAEDSHGTSCAGLIAARGFNNLGVVGVAPAAKMMGLRLIGEDAPDDATAEALLWQPEGVVTHISSNSWGPSDDGAATGRMSEWQAKGLETGAKLGRDGKGIVYVISAGNGRDEEDIASYDEFSSSRHAIQVCAVNKKGEQSSYSESGMALTVCALGGEMAPPDQMWTTNIMGEEAWNLLRQNAPTSTAPVNYTDGFNGTSAAAPQVSGTAALMLERNPNLGYRDVKEILMRTARREALKDGDEFATNVAGLSFSHAFGAGLVNVNGAVEVAGIWKNLPETQELEFTDADAADIPEGTEDGATVEFDASEEAALRVEHVEIVVDAAHPVRGDLSFAIVSPWGMVSEAERRPKDKGANFEGYRFTSTRHWGEPSVGVWKVKVIDSEENGQTGILKAVKLRIIGTPLRPVSDVDPAVVSVSGPATANAGQTVTLTANVRNTGSTAAGAFRVGLYLSGNTTITTADTRIGTCSYTGLAASGNVTCSVTAAIPAALRAGDYHVGAIADDTEQIAEVNEMNNAGAATNRITVRTPVLPDLIISDGSAPSTGVAGQAVRLNVEVTNQGRAAAGAFRVGIYLSADAVITRTDIQVATCNFPGLAVEASSTCGGNVTLAASLAPGTYYVGAFVDDTEQVSESDESNNTAVAPNRIVISRAAAADLTVTSVIAPTAVAPGGRPNITTAIRNEGTADAGAFRMGYYLSTDATITTADLLIGTCAYTGLAAGASSGCAGPLLFPATLAPGRYYFGAIVDDQNQVSELDETNNARAAASVITIQP